MQPQSTPRRRWIAAVVVAGLLPAAFGALAAVPAARDGKPVTPGVYGFRVRTIDGGEKSLADYRGKALLIVNTASRCGFTPQYASLEKLYARYHARGFEILAFPTNNFLSQEPGSNVEIKSFCTRKYKTTFPLFAKISVKGKGIAPLYAYLTRDSGHPGDIPWNFTKYLVAPDGRVVERFDPPTDPLEGKVTQALEAVLPAR